jgi:class 3 adenylate cyclase
LPEGEHASRFLLTDVEGSTALWEEAPGPMRVVLARHDALFEAAVAEHGGVHIRPRGEGDSRFAVFAGAPHATAAALAIQRAFAAEAWPTPRPIRVRIAIHTGEAELRDGDYYGPAVNRSARIRGVGHGGQTLLSGRLRHSPGMLCRRARPCSTRANTGSRI